MANARAGSVPASRRDLLGVRGPWWAALAIVVVLGVLYAPVRDFGFLNFDDDEYVTDNPVVRRGLTWSGARWAFTQAHAANWHPLAWLSHMLDVTLWGLAPAGHHLTSVALHAATAVMLLFALRRLTAAWQRSAAVALLFAVHPLRVESVAWIAERKDVLCGLWSIAAVWAYAGYVHRPTAARYAAVAAATALALLSKPMAVTLPFVFLLLDHWPLDRLRSAPVVREKLGLFGLVAGTAAVTFVVQRSAGAMASLDHLPLAYRLANVVVAYATYVTKLVWPSPLAVFYPYRPLPPAEIAGAALLLLAITAVALRLVRVAPYLLVGWLWFLGTLVPVIGFVKVGDQAMADRFTYTPHIGLLIATVWGTADLLARWPAARPWRAVGGAALVGLAAIAAAGVTAAYIPVWRDSESLFVHAASVTDDNHVAETNLGARLLERGRRDDAVAHFRRAIAISSGFLKAHVGLGAALAEGGDYDGAVREYEAALQIDPNSALARFDLGTARLRQGRLDDARAALEAAVTLEPMYARAHHQLGDVSAAAGDLPGAVAAYRRALAIAPDLAASHMNLAIALETLGQHDEALEHYRDAARLAPDNPGGHANLAAALAAAGRRGEAVAEYRAALRLRPGWPEVERALADLGATPAPGPSRP